MHRELNRPIVHIMIWVSLGIIVPSLPIIIGIVIAILQQVEISLTSLLDGIELLLISLGLVTATIIDLSKSEIGWSSRFRLFFFILLWLFALGIGNVILLTLIYVNERVASLQFDSDTKFAFVFILTATISLITIALQSYIGYIRYKKLTEETTA